MNKKHSTLSAFGVCVYVCVCVCARARARVLDREGTWVYSSVSTALVVVNRDSFVSDRLQ